MSGSLRLLLVKSASAVTTRPTRANGTTRNGSSCASTAAGAGATPLTARRAELTGLAVARNRKRAKERQRSRAGAAAARRSATERTAGLEDDVPESIRHAAPDVELAEAQLALGRPDLADADPELADAEPTFDDAEDPESLDEEEFEELEDEVDGAKPRGGRSRGDGAEADGAGAVATTGS